MLSVGKGGAWVGLSCGNNATDQPSQKPKNSRPGSLDGVVYRVLRLGKGWGVGGRGMRGKGRAMRVTGGKQTRRCFDAAAKGFEGGLVLILYRVCMLGLEAAEGLIYGFDGLICHGVRTFFS
jgi:hypothetical protein